MAFRSWGVGYASYDMTVKLGHFLGGAIYALAAACFAFALFVILTFKPSRFETLDQEWTASPWVLALILVVAGIVLLARLLAHSQRSHVDRERRLSAPP
jgi:hypothetical protein